MTSKDGYSVNGAHTSCAYVMLVNLSNETTIHKTTVLGVAEEISEYKIQDARLVRICPTRNEERGNKALYNNLYKKNQITCPTTKQLIEFALLKNAHVFHDETEFKGTDIIAPDIRGSCTTYKETSIQNPLRAEGRNEAQVEQMLKQWCH